MKRLSNRTQPWPLWRAAELPEDAAERYADPDPLPEGYHVVPCLNPACGGWAVEPEDVDSVTTCDECAL